MKYNIIPGSLNIEIVAGDYFSMEVSFNLSIAGITFTGAVTQKGSDVKAFTIDIIDEAKGVINLSMSEEDTLALLDYTGDRLGWYLTQSGTEATRTILAGNFTVLRK